MLASPTTPTQSSANQAQMAPAAAPVQQERAGAIVPLGYVLGFLFPIVGLVLGIVAWTRPAQATKKHGVWIILVSVLSFVGALLILAHMGSPASS
jgi:pheromone shutdown protein TraB